MTTRGGNGAVVSVVFEGSIPQDAIRTIRGVVHRLGPAEGGPLWIKMMRVDGVIDTYHHKWGPADEV